MSALRFAKAYLEIGNVCNLSCAFCHGTARKGEFMPPARFRVLAAALRPHTDHLYLHVLGEPLLHPDLPEILEIAASMGFRICITTNGVLLRERRALLLAFAPHIHKVSVSLHAFEANGLTGDYLLVCADFAADAAARGVIVALRLWNLGGDAETPSQNAENAHILAHLRDRFPASWQETRGGMKLADRVYIEYGETFDWPDMGARDYGACGFCYGLRDQVAVLVDGTVVPCCLDAEGDIPLGNLLEKPLLEIVASPRARAIKEGFDRREAVEALCRRCGYKERFRK